MRDNNEYVRALLHLYEKSLMLHDTSLFHPVLRFHFVDACAHLDYTLGLLSYNYASPKNVMGMESSAGGSTRRRRTTARSSGGS